jgi:hypothetical protein
MKWEQVNFQWDDDEVRFILDQNAEFIKEKEQKLVGSESE